MSSSDEEVEDLVLESVTNYYFENDSREPISFSGLPIIWNSSDSIQTSNLKIYLRGNAGGGMIYKPVKAWKFDISGVKPEISVLCKDNTWIKLLKARPSFEEACIRTILVTVYFLHLVKRNPESPGRRIWKKLSHIFSLHDTNPSLKDLLCHKALIKQASEQDESLKKSKCFMVLLEKIPQMKQKADQDDLSQGKSQTDVDDDDDDNQSDDLEDESGDEENGSGGEGDGSVDDEDDEEDSFDSVCSICDEGGSILCCEGICMRSFHATLRAGRHSKCRSLGFTEKQVQEMDHFECENCRNKLHQCFACGKLGSSDKQAGAEVHQCVNATCGYFYHPQCVSKLLRPDIGSAKDLEGKIRAGESFTCPLHICFVCKLAGEKSNPEMQMAVCRRCPKAYHRKCLPKKIAFEEDEDKGIEQRAWEDLLVDRILIYCLKHKIIEDLGTPARNHIQLTIDDKKEKGTLTGLSVENKVPLKKKIPVLKTPSSAPLTVVPKKKTIVDNEPDKVNDLKSPKLQRSITPKKLVSEKKPIVEKQKDLVKPTLIEELESTKLSKVSGKKFVLDSDSERRIVELMSEASSMITLDDVIEKHEKLISSRSYKQKMDPCKSITLGKVEGSCKAVREAAKKLEEGSSVKEAESICGRTTLNQIVKWKGKLRVYLAPFLHGMRYTSFGRHFTKIEKLKEIADTLQWYVRDDDTIVDFCCGANDFSVLMKERLESRGKKCNFRNFDLFPPKNDFCFEKRDWMDVKTDELPTGSKLIMGINPPFGVKASKANQFINKALEFKPKLIILIVPVETERLDKKKDAYDLIWEQKDKLSGKSFYLPGSVDVNDKQMEDWNVEAPVLYLWSRHDWTSRHRDIARKYNHLPGQQIGQLTEDTSTKIMDRPSSFNDHDQSSIKPTEGDDTSPSTLPPKGKKGKGKKEQTGASNQNIENKSTQKGQNVNKHVNVVKESNRSKKNSKKKRKREITQVEVQRSGPSQSRKRPHNSPTKTRAEKFDQTTPHTSRYQEPLSSVEVREPVHDYHRPSSVEVRDTLHDYHRPSSAEVRDLGHDYHRPSNVGPGNFEDPYYPDPSARYYQQGDNHPSRRPELHNFHPGYPPQNLVNSNLGYASSNMHGHGLNHSYGGSVEQHYMATPYLSLHTNTSAIDKYNFSLDRGGMRANNYGGPDLGPSGLYHNHQSQPMQGYPNLQMEPGSRPPNPSYPGPSGGWLG